MQSQVHPGTSAPSGEPPRRRPVWLYILAGCGGCALLVVVVLGIVTASFVGGIQKDMGSMERPAVQQALGAEVPIYPNGTYDKGATSGAVMALRIMERASRKKPGDLFKGVAAVRTQDDAGKILDYYDKELGGNGWKAVQSRDSGFQEQKVYRKGQEVVVVQVQSQGSQQVVTVMRGGPELANRRSRRSRDGATPPLNAPTETRPVPGSPLRRLSGWG